MDERHNFFMTNQVCTGQLCRFLFGVEPRLWHAEVAPKLHPVKLEKQPGGRPCEHYHTRDVLRLFEETFGRPATGEELLAAEKRLARSRSHALAYYNRRRQSR
jgi:hypothetical protein